MTLRHSRLLRLGRPGLGRSATGRVSGGQSLVEFTLVFPIMLVLLVTVADFGRLFATGITVETAARDGAEIAAQEYRRDPPTPGDPAGYARIHGYAVDVVCRELKGLPNAGYVSGDCTGVPTIVCVHDGADPSCSAVAPAGASVPAQCTSFATPPSSAQASSTETSRYVEVRVCYRFSTLLALPPIAGIPFLVGDFYLERDRVFTVADY